MSATSNRPIVCDMTNAVDSPDERLALYTQLFGAHLKGRERTPTGIRFRFRADPGVVDLVRDLAAREKACCWFFDFTITVAGEEIAWDADVIDDPVALAILDEFFRLPDTLSLGADALFERFADQGLAIVVDEDGDTRPAPRAEVGLSPA